MITINLKNNNNNGKNIKNKNSVKREIAKIIVMI